MSLQPSTGSIDVKYVAHLARMHLSDQEVELFQGQLEQIVAYVDELKKLDVSHVEPTAHATPVYNVLRKDEPRECIDHEAVMKNAPVAVQGQFGVPRIIE